MLFIPYIVDILPMDHHMFSGGIYKGGNVKELECLLACLTKTTHPKVGLECLLACLTKTTHPKVGLECLLACLTKTTHPKVGLECLLACLTKTTHPKVGLIMSCVASCPETESFSMPQRKHSCTRSNVKQIRGMFHNEFIGTAQYDLTLT